MKKTLLCLLLLSGTAVFAQTPDIKSLQTLGGKTYDYGYSITQTTDKGFMMAGYAASRNGMVTGSHGGVDCWVVKFDKQNNVVWTKALGGNGNEWGNCIQSTADGGAVIAGTSNSNDGDVSGNHGEYDYWVVKLNSAGNIEWQKSLGGTDDDQAHSIQPTADNGYIVAGSSYSNDNDVSGNHGDYDYWVVKLSSTGSIEWQKSLGGTEADEANSIRQASNGSYIVAGYSTSNDGDVSGHHGLLINPDYWVVKLSGSGNIQWQKSLGGGDDEEATSVYTTSDDGYVVAGSSFSNDGDVSGNHGLRDYWIVKLNSSGKIKWQKSLGGANVDDANSIEQTNDDGFIIAGQTSSNDGDVSGYYGTGDFWIVKLNGSGNLEWQKCVGGNRSDEAFCVHQATNGEYVVAGGAESFDGDATGLGTNGKADYWFLRLKKDPASVEVAEVSTAKSSTAQLLAATDFKAYPVPAKDVLQIQTNSEASFSLINENGKTVMTKTLKGNGSFTISALPAGIYYLKNNTSGKQQRVLITK